MTKKQLETRVQELERRIDIIAEAFLEFRQQCQQQEPKPKAKADTRAAIIKADCDDANATPLPPQLDNDKFRPEWAKFCKWRTTCATTGRADGRKFGWTRHIAERLLNRCARWGTLDSIAAILHSLDRYPDLYEPEERTQSNSKPQQQAQFII